MPVAGYRTYCEMLDRARARRFAYPAVNVTSLTTANAVLKGLAESRSDGIIQISTGGGTFASGIAVKDVALGAVSIAEHVHRATCDRPGPRCTKRDEAQGPSREQAKQPGPAAR
jgi:fructose-bisphosphate aldolase class II